MHHNKRMASRAAAVLELRWGFWRAGEPRAWQAHKRRRSTPFVWQHGCRNSAQTRHSNSYSRGISRAAGQRCRALRDLLRDMCPVVDIDGEAHLDFVTSQHEAGGEDVDSDQESDEEDQGQ